MPRQIADLIAFFIFATAADAEAVLSAVGSGCTRTEPATQNVIAPTRLWKKLRDLVRRRSD